MDNGTELSSSGNGSANGAAPVHERSVPNRLAYYLCPGAASSVMPAIAQVDTPESSRPIIINVVGAQGIDDAAGSHRLPVLTPDVHPKDVLNNIDKILEHLLKYLTEAEDFFSQRRSPNQKRGIALSALRKLDKNWVAPAALAQFLYTSRKFLDHGDGAQDPSALPPPLNPIIYMAHEMNVFGRLNAGTPGYTCTWAIPNAENLAEHSHTLFHALLPVFLVQRGINGHADLFSSTQELSTESANQLISVDQGRIDQSYTVSEQNCRIDYNQKTLTALMGCITHLVRTLQSASQADGVVRSLSDAPEALNKTLQSAKLVEFVSSIKQAALVNPNQPEDCATAIQRACNDLTQFCTDQGTSAEDLLSGTGIQIKQLRDWRVTDHAIQETLGLQLVDESVSMDVCTPPTARRNVHRADSPPLKTDTSDSQRMAYSFVKLDAMRADRIAAKMSIEHAALLEGCALLLRAGQSEAAYTLLRKVNEESGSDSTSDQQSTPNQSALMQFNAFATSDIPMPVRDTSSSSPDVPIAQA